MKSIENLRYKRTLFVGIGGAGNATLSILKQKIKDANNGKIPGQVKFLLIDTNATELTNLRDFNCNEKICVAVRDPYQRYMKDQGTATHAFIPDRNTPSLLALERGAGQIRSNGHFAIIENQYSNKLMRIFRERADELENIDIQGDTLERDPKIEVRLVFSLAGGTGSGSFLPIATLLRAAIKHCELTAYIYSATHYERIVEKSAKKTVMQNAYAALAEVDYMMHFGLKDRRYEPIKFNFGPHETQQLEQTNRPFEEVYYIDKYTAMPLSNSIEFAYNELDRMRQNTAEVMHIASTNIISAHTGVVDNVRQKIMEGQFNVDDKFAWISGVGLAELYLNRLNKNDEKLIHSCLNAIEARTDTETQILNLDEIATKFIKEFKLNEAEKEEDGDPVLSRIIKADDIRSICIDQIKHKDKNITENYDPFKYRLDYIINRSVNEYGAKCDSADEIIEEFRKNIRALIISLIDDGCDLINNNARSKVFSLFMVVQVLDAIKSKLSQSKETLRSEKTEHEVKRENWRKEYVRMTNANNNVQPQRRRLFNRNANNQVPQNTVRFQANDILDSQANACIEDILCQRYAVAITIFETCMTEVDAEMQRMEEWRKTFENAYKVGKNINAVRSKQDAECTERKENRVEVTMLQIQDGFQMSYKQMEDIISKRGTIYQSPEGIFDAVCELIAKASGSLQDYLSLKDNRSRQRAIERLIDLSTPTMQVDRHGYGDKVRVDTFWYIITDCDDSACNDDKDNKKSVGSLLKDILEDNILEDKVYKVHVKGWKDKAILYRVKSAVPPYFVEGVCAGTGGGHTLEGCYEELKRTKPTYTPFSHETLRQKLENAITVLKPNDSATEEQALEHWVNFQLLNLIKFEPCADTRKKTIGRYSIASDRVGTQLIDSLEFRNKVLILGETRKEAYETFARYCKVLVEENPEYQEMIDEVLNEKYGEEFAMTGEVYMNRVFGEWKNMRFVPQDPEYLQLQKEMDYMDKRHKEFATKVRRDQDLAQLVKSHRENPESEN